jgi:hypothetical protein
LIPYTGFSGITTTTMLDVGVARFPELADASNDVSLSVLKIFKILFGAVSLYPKEVEQYFKPLLQKIFHQGFGLCMRARDPYNLLLMFRAFFRAMGGGGHEVGSAELFFSSHSFPRIFSSSLGFDEGFKVCETFDFQLDF